MLYILISLLLGMIPDVLYYVLLITKIKNVKEKRLILFILLAITYITTYMIFRYNFYLYMIHGIIIYLVIKFLYKSKINDYFLIIFLYSYYFINSLLCYFLISNYNIALIVNKIMLFVPLIFIKKLQKLYQNYNKMWNRNDSKNYLDRTYQRLNGLYGTVGYVSSMFPNNTLLITMNGHIVCSKNGVIYDTFDCRDRKVEDVWLVN